MTFKGFLTLVGGAGIPYLRGKEDIHTAGQRKGGNSFRLQPEATPPQSLVWFEGPLLRQK